MTTLNLIVLSLAVYRIARFVGWDQITQRVRQRLTGWDDDQNRNAWPANRRWIAEMIHCSFCFSAWAAVAVWIAFQYEPRIVMLGAWPLAINAAAGLIAKNWDA